VQLRNRLKLPLSKFIFVVLMALAPGDRSFATAW